MASVEKHPLKMSWGMIKQRLVGSGHTVLSVQWFMAKNKMAVVSYSLDLVLCSLKLQRKKFNDVLEIQQTSQQMAYLLGQCINLHFEGDIMQNLVTKKIPVYKYILITCWEPPCNFLNNKTETGIIGDWKFCSCYAKWHTKGSWKGQDSQ
jgi:hypothetical protein